MMTLINLTPHPIRVYPIETPDQIDGLDTVAPLRVLEPSKDYPAARLAMIELGNYLIDGVRIEYVEYGHIQQSLPYNPRDSRTDWFVVSLVVALGCRRDDFLVPYLEVRNIQGTVIGCRMLARPV